MSVCDEISSRKASQKFHREITTLAELECKTGLICASKQDHTSQYLQHLHWLPHVNKKILYKMFLYVYKRLTDQITLGLPFFCINKAIYYNLCSATDTSPLIKGLKSAFDRTFLELSISKLCYTASLASFKKELKIYVFS